MVAEAILKNLHQKIFDEVIARADIPTEFGNQEDLTKAGEELQHVFKDRLIRARLAEEGSNFCTKIIFTLDDITMKKETKEKRERTGIIL